MKDTAHEGIIKGLAALFKNPKADADKVFPEDLPPTSSLRRLSKPFYSQSDESFQAIPQVLEDGCYLIYDSASGGTLVLHYSHRAVPENAVGFWKPGCDKTIQSWKYETAGGYSELLRGIVGGTQNRKRYYNGWCQFVQLAKSMKGEVKIVEATGQSLAVDLYGYSKGRVQPISKDCQLENVIDLEAIACVPRHNDRFKGVHNMEKVAFMQHGNLEGAALSLHA